MDYAARIEDYRERAAIMEYDGGLCRADAEALAKESYDLDANLRVKPDKRERETYDGKN